MRIVSSAALTGLICSLIASTVYASALEVFESTATCATIKAAIDALDDGGTIQLHSGSYDFSCLPYVLSKDLTIEGLTGGVVADGGGKEGFKLAAGASLTLKSIEFTDFTRVVTHSGLGGTVNRLVFDNIVVTDSEAGIVLSKHVYEAWIVNSTFKNLTGDNNEAGGVHMAYTLPSPESSGRIHIANNNFIDMERIAGTAEFHAIIVSGHQVNIVNNTIRNFACNSDTSCEAIYTKATMSQTIGNSIYNAEGAGIIVVKGGSGQQHVKDNIISTPLPADLAAGFSNARVIDLYADEVVVAGNSIYHAQGIAIADDVSAADRLVIQDNYIYGPRNAGATIRVRSDDAVIEGNTILNPVIDVATGVNLVHIQGPNFRNVDNINISNNSFTVGGDLTASSLNFIKIWAYSGKSITNVTIQDNIAKDLGANASVLFISDSAGADPGDGTFDVNNTLVGF